MVIGDMALRLGEQGNEVQGIGQWSTGYKAMGYGEYSNGVRETGQWVREIC